MDKLRTWIHRQKKDCEHVVEPLTSSAPCEATKAVETPGLPLQKPDPTFDLRTGVRSRDLRIQETVGGRGPVKRRVESPLPSVRRLPGSPPIGTRGWSSAPSSPALSRLWVEAALQRSKCDRNRRPSPSRGDKKEGERGPSDAAFRWIETPCGGEAEELLHLHPNTYCQMVPCICSRCPSAPPYEDQNISPGYSSADGKQTFQGSDIQRTRDGPPRLDGGPRLYPSLSPWLPEAPEHNQGVNDGCSRHHGNSGDHLPWRDSDVGCNHLTGHPCRHCAQVICCRCLCRFISLLQVHHGKPSAGL